MNSTLFQIRDFIQSYIEITCSIIEFDIYVVDNRLIRIAGTSQFKDFVGLSLPLGSANHAVMESRELLIMDNPLENSICESCPIKTTGKCLKEHMIIYPIVEEDMILGSITIVALTDPLKIKMKQKKTDLIAFLEKLGESITGKIKEKESSDRLLSLLDSINEGIVLTDFEGKILQHNNVVSSMLKSKDNIKQILPKDFFENLFEDSKCTGDYECEVELKLAHQNLRMYLSAKHINENSTTSDILIVLRHKKEISNIAYNLLADASHLDINIDSIIGNSKLINQTKALAEQAAKYDSTVLILGESGTGKELFARSIHEMSGRKAEPFIAINCAAIPENLLESELFGYESGAFTGAKKSGKPGKFELANGGTIFLDEVGDLALHLQPKLLRVLEHGHLERIGGVESIKLDVRVIAATNKDLEEMVRHAEFREDLFYRLCVIPISIAPLRKRPEDIVILAEFFLDKYNGKLDKNIMILSEDYRKQLLFYDWPGNVRELENVIEYSVNIETTDKLTLPSLPNRVVTRVQSDGEKNLKMTRKEYIETLVLKYGRSLKGKQQIADELGISLSTLYRDLKKYNL